MAQSLNGKTVKSSKPTKRKRGMIVAAVVAALVVVVFPTFVLAYAGFIPVATEVLQTNKPVDLGVTYNQADFASFQEKSLISVSGFDGTGPSPQGSELVITPANTIGNEFTQQEITAALNSIHWTRTPLTNAQVRFSDGIIELSGNVNAQYVTDVLKTVTADMKGANVGTVLQFAQYLHNPAVYVKAQVSVDASTDANSGGILHFQLLDFKVNRFSLPDDVMNGIRANEPVTVKTSSMDGQGGYDVRTLSISDGMMKFYGTVPGELHLGNGDPRVICDYFHGGDILALDSVDGRVGSTVSYCQ